jgi:hypothetical protein
VPSILERIKLTGNPCVLSQLAVFPARNTFTGSDPEIPVAPHEQRSNFAAREMLTGGRLPGDAPNAVETK